MTLRDDLPGVLTDLEDVEAQVRAGAGRIRPVLARYTRTLEAAVDRRTARDVTVSGTSVVLDSWLISRHLSADQLAVLKGTRSAAGVDDPVTDAWLDRVAQEASRYAAEPELTDPTAEQAELERIAALSGCTDTQVKSVVAALCGAKSYPA